MTDKRTYCHIVSRGEDTPDFITSEEDFIAAMNRTAVCAANTAGIQVVAFSFEETHPHFLLYGTLAGCRRFAGNFERSTIQYIWNTRGRTLVFELEVLPVDSDDYLRNVGTYIITQPTKDRKPVMPYDYLWGTGSLYFRSGNIPTIWHFRTDGALCREQQAGELSINARRALLRTKKEIPPHWTICNGIILPENYVDIQRFENIYATHNCFRTFLSAGKKAQEQVSLRISAVRGIEVDDLEARELCVAASVRLFGRKDPRSLNVDQRVRLAIFLRREHRLSPRQIATLVHLKRSSLDSIL